MIPALVIFDCDGVLVDTEPVSNTVLSAALARHDFRISVEDCRLRFVGRTIESVQAEVEAEIGRALGADWPERVRRETEAAFDSGVRPVPGVEAVIDAVAGAGLTYCVASSGKFSKMRKTLGQRGCCGTSRVSFSVPSRSSAASPRPISFFSPPSGWAPHLPRASSSRIVSRASRPGLPPVCASLPMRAIRCRLDRGFSTPAHTRSSLWRTCPASSDLPRRADAMAHG